MPPDAARPLVLGLGANPNVPRAPVESAPDEDGAVPALGVDHARTARSVVWSVVENGGLALVSFGSLVIYSRFLSAAQFGVFSIALAVVELLSVWVAMLFHDALVQKERVTPLHFDTAFTFTLGLALVSWAACWLLAPTFATLVGSSQAGSVLAWTALCLPATAISATLVAKQRRELSFKSLAVRSLVGRVSGALVGIGLVAFGAGLWGLVAQQVSVALLASLVLWLSARERPRLRFRSRELYELLGFGAYAMTALFLTFAVKRVFVIMAGTSLGSEAAGYLNLSFRAVDVLWAIAATAITQVALPVLARLQSSRERLQAAYRTAQEFTCLVLYPSFVGIALVAPELVELLFGAQWSASGPYVAVLGLMILIQAPRLLITPTLTALGRPRDALPGMAAELVVMLALLSTLKVSSLNQAMAIWIVREVVGGLVMVGLLRRTAGISLREQLGAVVVPLVASATMAAAVLALREVLARDLPPIARLGLLAAPGAVAFLLAAWLIGPASFKRAFDFFAASRGRTPQQV